MNSLSNSGCINVQGLNLWAHVGALEKERTLGQYFSLDFCVWIDLENVLLDDDVSSTADYSIAIKGLQELSFTIECNTIEKFSEAILNYLESLYGLVPVKVCLTKCSPPISGFSGKVSVYRTRNFQSDEKCAF
ncbi:MULTISPECIES: dihydroneopterin aldolase [Prochlorococcus]|uniref:dihydroneopterin aldolase n=1 Tax=Prochlorococcus TaxID=1218 RepID=UPI00055B41C9